MARLYRETVKRLPLGEQANLFWQDNAEDYSEQGRTVRRLPLHVQLRWQQHDWRELLRVWVEGLPRIPWKVAHPDIHQKEFRL
jgi:hypothetical protein